MGTFPRQMQIRRIILWDTEFYAELRQHILCQVHTRLIGGSFFELYKCLLCYTPETNVILNVDCSGKEFLSF